MSLDTPADVNTSAPAMDKGDPGEISGSDRPPLSKVKIDDEEYDLDTLQKEFKRYKGKYEGSERKFQEAAQMRKQVEGLLQRAQQGDLSWLKGLVPEGQLRKWQQEELLQHIEWEELPEAERARRIAERERDKYKSELEETKKSKEQQEQSLLESKAYAEIDADISAAIKELGHDVKITPRLVRRIAERMVTHIEASDSDDPQEFKRVPAKEARDEILSEGKELVPELLSVLPVEQAIAMIPQKLREAIRKADIEDVSSQMPTQRSIRGDKIGDLPPKKDKFKRMSTDEFFQRMEKRVGR